MRPIHMLWLKRYCLAPCFYFTALRQWRQLQLPYFVHCRLQFDKFSSFVVLFPSSNSTHIAQLRAWMQPVFDKHQIKIKSIQLCQTTDLPCPVAVKTISALSFLGPQMRYVFPSNKELSVTLVSNHFISEQAFLFFFNPSSSPTLLKSQGNHSTLCWDLPCSRLASSRVKRTLASLLWQ